MSRSLHYLLVQRWLMALLAVVSVHSLVFHIAPSRITAASVGGLRFPGQLLADLPGEASDMQAVGVTQRRRLVSGEQLLLTNLASGTMEGFQLASLTRLAPALQMKSRRLFTTPQGQIALGTIQGRPAAQTCLIGSRAAVTAEALLDLFPRDRQFSSQWFAGVLGLRPAPIQRCTLVTLIASQPKSLSVPSQPSDLGSKLSALLPTLTLQ